MTISFCKRRANWEGIHSAGTYFWPRTNNHVNSVHGYDGDLPHWFTNRIINRKRIVPGEAPSRNSILFPPPPPLAPLASVSPCVYFVRVTHLAHAPPSENLGNEVPKARRVYAEGKALYSHIVMYILIKKKKKRNRRREQRGVTSNQNKCSSHRVRERDRLLRIVERRDRPLLSAEARAREASQARRERSKTFGRERVNRRACLLPSVSFQKLKRYRARARARGAQGAFVPQEYGHYV